MTRQEKKILREKQELEFLENKEDYINECFIKNDDYYKMKKILDSSVERGTSKEFGYELHHFIPRSYFKKKNKIVIDKNNLYKLTYQEHFMVHYYAYKCSTKLMKTSMCLALLLMKKVCNKNTNEYDTMELSKIFDSIKSELYTTKKNDYKIQSFQNNKKKLEEKTQGRFLLLDVNYIYEESNRRTELKFKCKKCGKEYTMKCGSHFLQNAENFKCDCERGFKENVIVLWFGINKFTNEAEWEISHYSYTPSMKQCGAFITKREIYTHMPKFNLWWKKITLIDIQKEGYDWKLNENKRLKRTNCFSKCNPNLMKQFVDFFWKREDISNNFIQRLTNHSVKDFEKCFNLPKRKTQPNYQLYDIDGFNDCLCIKDWENKLHLSWYKIQKQYNCKPIMNFGDFFMSISDLYKNNKLLFDIIIEVIPFAVNQGITDEDFIWELVIDAYLYVLGYSDEQINEYIDIINDGKDVKDFLKD